MRIQTIQIVVFAQKKRRPSVQEYHAANKSVTSGFAGTICVLTFADETT